MKNTLANKKLFTASYYGQNIMRYSNWADDFEANGFDGKFYRGCPAYPSAVCDTSFLEVKPLSSISDKDAHIVCNILRVKQDNQIIKIMGHSRIQLLKNNITHNGGIGFFVNTSERMLHAYDYLRSKDYAVVWRGVPVRTQLKFGWIRLRT